jgi:hypothetical protein
MAWQRFSFKLKVMRYFGVVVLLNCLACEPDNNPPDQKRSMQYRDFSCDIRTKDSSPVIRYKKNNIVITRGEIIAWLTKTNKEGFDFRFLFNRCIAELPKPTGSDNGYMMQAPIINSATKNAAFYWVAEKSHFGHGGDLFKNYLVQCDPQPKGARKTAEYSARFFKLFATKEHLTGFQERSSASHDPPLPFGAAIFKGGRQGADPSEMMTVPCPIDPDLSAPVNKAIAHIYSFARSVNDDQNDEKQRRLNSFWYAVGVAAQKMFNGQTVTDFDGNPKTALFPNTHGNVPYLHFRLENDPRYYAQGSPLTNERDSEDYYAAVFP